MASKLTKTTIDHEEIRRWAEERGGKPAEVMGTERGGTGMIRIDFPGFSGEGDLRPIEWDEWFEKFDASGLALIYQESLASGERSNFNKLIARETAEARQGGASHASRRRLRAGGGGRGRGATATRARRSGTARTTGRTTPRKGAARGEGGSRAAPSAVAARLTGRAGAARAQRSGKGTAGRRGGRGGAARGGKGGKAGGRGAGRSRRRS